MQSTEGPRLYATRSEVHTPTFGSTTYSGRIALLHIDGHHSDEATTADVAAWGCDGYHPPPAAVLKGLRAGTEIYFKKFLQSI